MIGCMVASSLSLAPAHLLAQLADLADLDGPLWLSEDRPDKLVFDGPSVSAHAFLMGLRPFGGEARFYLLPLYRQDQIPTRPVRLTNFQLD